MTHVQWDPSLDTGDPQVDAEHKDIYALVSEMSEAVAADTDGEAVDAAIARLLSYSRSHFAHEERLMECSGYPDLARHRQLHEDFSEQVEQLADERLHGGTVSPTGLVEFLQDWLEEHIDREDRRLVEHLRNEQELM